MCRQEQDTLKYYALQITNIFPDSVTILLLDYFELTPPNADNFIETEEREDLCMAFSEIVDSVLHQINGEDAVLDRVKIEDALDAARDW